MDKEPNPELKPSSIDSVAQTEKVPEQSDAEALEELKSESLQRIKYFYLNRKLKERFPEFFGTEKVINKDVKQYTRDQGIDRDYLAHPVLVGEKEVEDLLRTPEFIKDQDFMLEAARLDLSNIVCASRSLLTNHDFLMKLNAEFGPKALSVIYHTIEHIRIDEEAVFEALKKDATLIMAVLDKVRDEDRFVSEAINANPDIIRYLPSYLREKRSVFLQALKNGFDDFYFVIPRGMEDDREINVLFLKNSLNPFNLSPKFHDDESLLAEAFTKENIMRVLGKHIERIQHFPKSVLEDTELVKEIMAKFPEADVYIKLMEEHYGAKFI